MLPDNCSELLYDNHFLWQYSGLELVDSKICKVRIFNFTIPEMNCNEYK